MSMNWMGGLNHKYEQRPTSYTNSIHSQVDCSLVQHGQEDMRTREHVNSGHRRTPSARQQ